MPDYSHHGRTNERVYGLLAELDTDGATGSDTQAVPAVRCHGVWGVAAN